MDFVNPSIIITFSSLIQDVIIHFILYENDKMYHMRHLKLKYHCLCIPDIAQPILEFRGRYNISVKGQYRPINSAHRYILLLLPQKWTKLEHNFMVCGHNPAPWICTKVPFFILFLEMHAIKLGSLLDTSMSRMSEYWAEFSLIAPPPRPANGSR